MSETVEDDENMIVLVVGDEENSNGGQLIQIPDPITIKIEPLEDSADNNNSENEIFTSPAQTEQENAEDEHDGVSLEGINIKDELEEEYEVEYLEDIPDEYEFDDYNEDNDDSDYDYKSSKTKPRKKARKSETRQSKTPRSKSPQTKTPQQKPQKYFSYVKYLRKEYPEMAEDEQLLVDHLAGVMRSLRPPEPPENYCKIVIVEGQLKYECATCGMHHDTRPLAARHYQFKHGEFYLTCYACGTKYRNTTNLYKHEKRCPAPDARVALRARGAYLGRKGRGRPYATNNRFITANTPLANKEKTRLFCSKCPASFAHRENLVAHENSHEGRRPFRCHHCDMAYTSYPTLKRHLKLHGEYQYICDHCGRKFKLKPALVSHLDSHRPVRKHACQYCERRFAQKTALRHHTNKVHLNLPAAHGCPVCPKRYARLTHVKEHMGRVHGLTMITRRMYFQALPSMTDSEVTHARKLFNFDVNQETEPKDPLESPERIVPEITGRIIKHKGQLQKFVQIIQKKQQGKPLNYVQEGPEHDSDSATYHIESSETEEKILEAPDEEQEAPDEEQEAPDEEQEAPDEKQEEKPKLKRKRKRYPRKIKPEPPTIVDKEIDDDICNMEYKRRKRTIIPAQEKKKHDDKMHEIVRNIKSTLTNRKVITRAEKKTKNFYELKQEFMNELKNEIDIPSDVNETKEKKPETLAPEEISQENLVPGTEIPVNLVPPKKEATDDSGSEEDWKVYKDVSEKNMVIADFLKYVKSGVVPKHVRILRRGRQVREAK